jgi:hypothetical protein
MDLVVDLVAAAVLVIVIPAPVLLAILHQHHHHKEILVEMVLVEQIQIMLAQAAVVPPDLDLMDQTQMEEMVEQELHQQ